MKSVQKRIEEHRKTDSYAEALPEKMREVIMQQLKLFPNGEIFEEEKRRKKPNFTNEEIGQVYLINEEGTKFYKIGRAKSESRVKELQTGNPRKLILVHRIKVKKPGEVEYLLHSEMYHCQIRGEWFFLIEHEKDRTIEAMDMFASRTEFYVT